MHKRFLRGLDGKEGLETIYWHPEWSFFWEDGWEEVGEIWESTYGHSVTAEYPVRDAYDLDTV